MFQCLRHTFPIRGHSFLPNDQDFGRTEVNKRQNERIYTPNQWTEQHHYHHRQWQSNLTVKANIVADITKIAKKYVPQELHSYYDSILAGEDISSETDESEEWLIFSLL